MDAATFFHLVPVLAEATSSLTASELLQVAGIGGTACGLALGVGQLAIRLGDRLWGRPRDEAVAAPRQSAECLQHHRDMMRVLESLAATQQRQNDLLQELIRATLVSSTQAEARHAQVMDNFRAIASTRRAGTGA